MDKYDKLIFVCTGNTCRSPMAEALFRGMELSGGIKVMSRGMVVHFPEPINPKAELVLNNHNISLAGHMARQLSLEDIRGKTLLLTMGEYQLRKIVSLFPNAKNVYPIKEYVGEDGEVKDPYGGTLMDYEECFAELARLTKKTVYRLAEE